jgi:hypothetical protein
VTVLSSPRFVGYTVVRAWSVRGLLAWIANVSFTLDLVHGHKCKCLYVGLLQSVSPSFHSLVDTGALITGMTNRQVAESLLKLGLKAGHAPISFSDCVLDGFTIVGYGWMRLSGRARSSHGRLAERTRKGAESKTGSTTSLWRGSSAKVQLLRSSSWCILLRTATGNIFSHRHPCCVILGTYHGHRHLSRS